jgi:uncharacterized membrane protein
METLMDLLAPPIVSALELVAVVVVAIGAIEAVIGLTRLAFSRKGMTEQRAYWLRFAHWLVVALTFELAADIVATTMSPSWTDLGKLATIAVVRTFLTYFLDRDVEKTSHLAHLEHGAVGA